MPNWRRVACLLAVLAAAAPATLAWGVIEALTPLSNMIGDADEICVVEVTQLQAGDKPRAVLKVVDDLQGKLSWRELPVNLRGGSKVEREKMLPRLADELRMVLFVTHDMNKELVYGFSNGTWFQILGQRDGEQVRWGFTHVEPYLPRTYNGSTSDLSELLKDVLAGKRKPPPANPDVRPGLGPEVAVPKVE